MSNNQNQPAYPLVEESAGLTKLERFTMAAMQGLCAASESRERHARRGLGQKALDVAVETMEAIDQRVDTTARLASALITLVSLAEQTSGPMHPAVLRARLALDQYRGIVV